MKRDRLEIIRDLIRTERLASQQDLLAILKEMGVDTTQASVSRDLKSLGVVKVDGYYRMSRIGPGESSVVDFLDGDCAGDNMLVFRTGPGNATRAALEIDKAQIPGILGTIAGDDAIFVAVKDKKSQSKIFKSVFELFGK